MPVRQSNNNKILPANARNADVAHRAIQEILPVQQMRYQSAFRVQGYEGVLYNRLYQGQKCTCQSSQKHLATRLDSEGKASPGLINELMTGAVFNVSPYGRDRDVTDPFDSVVSPDAPVNKHQGVFDNVGTDERDITNRTVVDGYGDNGPAALEFDINSLAEDWDADTSGSTEASCAICFGSGFVGGYTPLYGNRIVVTADQVELGGGDVLDPAHKPWQALSEQGFAFTAVFPFKAVSLDIFRVMFGHKPVPCRFAIDGQPVNEVSVLKYCDGRPHRVDVGFTRPQQFTHVEIQFKTSIDPAFFEFPKLNKSSDLTLLDNTEPFQIILSPMIPSVNAEDVFTDSTYGKTLIVQNVNTWNTRNRQVLGWECQVRVAQPQELYTVLPKRTRVPTKSQTSNLAHDNITGYRRT